MGGCAISALCVKMTRFAEEMLTSGYQGVPLLADSKHSWTPRFEGGRKNHRVPILHVTSTQSLDVMDYWRKWNSYRCAENIESFSIYLWCAWLAGCQVDGWRRRRRRRPWWRSSTPPACPPRQPKPPGALVMTESMSFGKCWENSPRVVSVESVSNPFQSDRFSNHLSLTPLFDLATSSASTNNNYGIVYKTKFCKQWRRRLAKGVRHKCYPSVLYSSSHS